MQIQTLSDTVARWSVLLLCGLTPFFFVPLPWVSLPQSKMLLTATLLFIALFSWGLARFYEGVVKIPAAIVVGIALLLPLAYALSAIVAGWHAPSLLGSGLEQDTLAVVCVLWGVLLAALVTLHDAPRKTIDALRALFIGGGILVLLQALHLFLPSLSFGFQLAGQTSNVFGNWHEFGIALGFFTIAGLGLFQSTTSGYWKYLFASVAGLSFVLLIIAGFVDVWVALGVIAFAVVVQRAHALKWQLGAGEWSVIVPWAVIVVVSMTILFFGAIISSALPQKLQIASFEVRPSWEGTYAVGRQALQSPASVMFGAGPNTFSREWSLYKPGNVNQTQFWNIDFPSGVGFVPTSFVTTGVLGALAWLAFVGCMVWLMWLLLVRRTLPEYFQGTAVPLLLAALYLMVFHVLYVPGPALNTLTFLVIGMLLAHTAAPLRVRSLTISLGHANTYLRWLVTGGAILALLVLLFATASVLRVLTAEVLLNKSTAIYAATADTVAASKPLNAALTIYSSSDRGHRLAVELGLREMQQLAAHGDANSVAVRAQFQMTLQATIEHGLTAVSINDGNYQNWLELASLYQELAGAKIPGALENARAAYEQARVSNPNSPLPAFNSARLDLLEGKRDAALKNIEEAIRLAPNFAAAHYVLSQITAVDGDFSRSITAAQAAVRYAPDDALAWYNYGVVLYSNKNYFDAAVALEQALARNAEYANALYLLGLSYYELDRTEDALKVFEALNALTPGESAVTAAIANIKAGRAPLQNSPLR